MFRKRAVDEQGFQLRVQQQDADRDLIERRAQRQHVPAQNIAAAPFQNGCRDRKRPAPDLQRSSAAPQSARPSWRSDCHSRLHGST